MVGIKKTQFVGRCTIRIVNQPVKLNLIYGTKISINGDDGTPSSETTLKFMAMRACRVFDEMPQSNKEALNLSIKSSNQL